MFYQAYQRFGYGTAACTCTRTRPRVIQQGRIRYKSICLRAWRFYQSVGNGWGSRTELTKQSGTGMDVVPNLPKCRVRLWMLYQVYQRVGHDTAAYTRTCTPPQVFQQGRTRYQGIFPRAYRTYQSVGYGWRSRTKLTKVSDTGMDDVPNPPKGRVPVWMLYQGYERVGYGYRGCTKLTKKSGTGIDFLPSLPKCRVR